MLFRSDVQGLGEAFTCERRTYSISRAGIAEALDVMVKREFARTLTNHNYLKQVMIGISEREGKAAGKTAEKDLRRRERKLMAGDREDDEPPPGGEFPPPREVASAPSPAREPKQPSRGNLTDEQIEANKRHVGALIEKL